MFEMPLKKNLPNCPNFKENEEAVYLLGNSLGLDVSNSSKKLNIFKNWILPYFKGLKPKSANGYLAEVMENWGKLGAHMHFEGLMGAAVIIMHTTV